MKLAIAVLFLLVSLPSRADNIGIFSFDSIDVGVNAFQAVNLTGVSATPPDFPVSIPLTFTNSSLFLTFADPLSSDTIFDLDGLTQTILAGSVSGTLSLGDLLEGDSGTILWSDTVSFTSATFSTSVNGQAVSVSLSGSPLMTGAFAIISTPASSSVPESSTLGCLLLGLSLLPVFRRRSSARER